MSWWKRARRRVAAKAKEVKLAREFSRGVVHYESPEDVGAPKVMLGCPYGYEVTGPHHQSVLRLMEYEYRKPWQERHLAKVVDASGLYIAQNRQILCERFYEGADTRVADWLLMVDSDIEFPEDLLERVLALAGKAEARVLGVNVPLGRFPSAAFKRTKKTSSHGIHECVHPLPAADPFEVDAVATAVILIHRQVLEWIARHHGQCWFNHIYIPYVPDGRPKDDPRQTKYSSIGEDLAFCVRCKRLGVPVWCAHGLPGLYHYKVRGLSEAGHLEEVEKVHKRWVELNRQAGVDVTSPGQIVTTPGPEDAHVAEDPEPEAGTVTDVPEALESELNQEG